MRPAQSRRAREFAVALEGPLSPSLAADPAMAPLLALAEQLRALPLGPTPQFRDALRTRLVAVATVAPAELAPATTWDRARVWVDHWRVQRGMAAAAAGMAAVVAIAGVTTASQRSLPGDPFYGLKRSAEGIQLSFARNPVNQGKRYLQHAETRLAEVAQLANKDITAALSPVPMAGVAGSPVALGGSRADRIARALADMNRDTRRGSQLLTKAYEDDDERSTEPLQVLSSFADRQQRGLYQLLFEIPVEARPTAQTSLALVTEVQQRATALITYGICGQACAPPDVDPTPGATPQPEPQPAPSPTSDALGPTPCDCAGTPSPAPTPGPQETPDPGDSNNPEPSPTPSPSPSEGGGGQLPLLPDPIGQTVEDLLNEVKKLLPSPLPVPVPLGKAAPL